MGVGRYVCVALPFILTVGSIICMLIAGLTGVTSNSLYIFQVDMRNASVDASTLSSLISNISSLENVANEISSRSPAPAPEPLDISSIISSLTGSGGSDNITAAELGIDKLYDVTLWNYCSISANGTDKNCTKAKFNWAETEFNTTFINDFGSDVGANITIPQEITDALNTFKPLMKWTEVVYIIAMVALGLELVVGLFTACSRLVSCLTWLISGIATLAVIAASAMMTAIAVVVVGAVKGAIGKYGGDASWNHSFLACIWIGVAFALGASLFWLFSVCCCAPERRPYAGRSRGGPEGEKFIPTGSYVPLGEQRNSGYNYGAPQRGGARSDLAYEPYSHAR
ncbi:SUR7/PalI family-domain-containing protein [Annulohypoxylon truncatum]|uniref:SUR7/PalI family-domain-containing protein n=1 Tax=Annulohypoxylon truncatum TaxID=327061 RepID=UPI00200780FB|nr:SUR7/PalI family-domain-containing protein [Annulohypoxylon truncatum]KAI1209126.1 SUR7/PalI family-domain-containing protein [Annulohypoxylon truncatum]